MKRKMFKLFEMMSALFGGSERTFPLQLEGNIVKVETINVYDGKIRTSYVRTTEFKFKDEAEALYYFTFKKKEWDSLKENYELDKFKA